MAALTLLCGRWLGQAVFEHEGVFHVMHQCDGGGPDGLPCGGGHAGPARHPHQSWWCAAQSPKPTQTPSRRLWQAIR